MTSEEPLTRSELRAQKRRERNEAAKAMPFWQKVTIVTVITVVGIGLTLAYLDSKPPKYAIADTDQTRAGVTLYEVSVPAIKVEDLEDDLLEIGADVYSKHKSTDTVAITFRCAARFAPDDAKAGGLKIPFEYLGIGNMVFDGIGNYELHTIPGSYCY